MGTCAEGNWQCWILNQANVLTNVANTVPSFQRLITGAAYLMGLAFLFKGIYSLKIYGEGRTMMSSSASLKEPVVYLLVGAFLLYFPSGLGVMMQTTFGYSNILQYAPINSGNSTLDSLFGSGSVVGRPLSQIIQLIGLIAFIRGWVLIARSASSGQQPGGTGKGLMHVVGGILAINIVGTLQIINNTLYGS